MPHFGCRIGAYQVCEKWLKDRQERTLSLDEIQTYQRILTALDRTIEIQQRLDEPYEAVEEKLIILSPQVLLH